MRDMPEQLVQIALAALRLAERRGLLGIGAWVHMLGFRGHFVTKSRGYSTHAACRPRRLTGQAGRDDRRSRR
jgi:hypothetical protein